MASSVREVSLLALLFVQVVATSCNLSNSESLGELKLVGNFAQYLRDNAVVDADGALLADRYLIQGPSRPTIGGRAAPLNQEALLDADKLRHDPSDPNTCAGHVWRSIATDMLLAIDAKRIPDERAAHHFRQQFVELVFHPWLDVIQERRISVLNLHNQDAAHQAIFEAHQDSFVLVRQRVIEKLSEVLPASDSRRRNSHHLPELTQWHIPGRVFLDYTRHELAGLRSYRELRHRYWVHLDEAQRNATIDVLPKDVDGAPRGGQYAKFELEERDSAAWLCSGQAGREIHEKCLVAPTDSSRMVEAASNAPYEWTPAERRRLVWKAIYRAVGVVAARAIAQSDAIDSQLALMLQNFRDAVVERANVLNGMLDSEVTQTMLDDFHLHRDNLNMVFARLADELPDERQEVYTNLMLHLGLSRVPATDPPAKGAFHLKLEHESLRESARQHFHAAVSHIRRSSSTLVNASDILAATFDETLVDPGETDAFMEAFHALRSPMSNLLRLLDGPDKLANSDRRSENENEQVVSTAGSNVDAEGPGSETNQVGLKLRDIEEELKQVVFHVGRFRTYMLAHIARTGDQRPADLLSIVLDITRELLGDAKIVERSQPQECQTS